MVIVIEGVMLDGQDIIVIKVVLVISLENWDKILRIKSNIYLKCELSNVATIVTNFIKEVVYKLPIGSTISFYSISLSYTFL